jgi:hypothetical protein
MQIWSLEGRPLTTSICIEKRAFVELEQYVERNALVIVQLNGKGRKYTGKAVLFRH